MPRHKQLNQQLCDQQNGLCALCVQPIPEGPNRMCYYEPKNVVVCRVCNVLIHNYVRLFEPWGVSLDQMTKFLARPAAPEPSAVEVVHHKTLSPEQLRNRLLAAKGGWTLTLAEYDQRCGGSGPVIDPDTGLEWVRPSVGEHTPPDERMFIDGVECDAGGEPIE